MTHLRYLSRTTYLELTSFKLGNIWLKIPTKATRYLPYEESEYCLWLNHCAEYHSLWVRQPCLVSSTISLIIVCITFIHKSFNVKQTTFLQQKFWKKTFLNVKVSFTKAATVAANFCFRNQSFLLLRATDKIIYCQLLLLLRLGKQK